MTIGVLALQSAIAQMKSAIQNVLDELKNPELRESVKYEAMVSLEDTEMEHHFALLEEELNSLGEPMPQMAFIKPIATGPFEGFTLEGSKLKAAPLSTPAESAPDTAGNPSLEGESIGADPKSIPPSLSRLLDETEVQPAAVGDTAPVDQAGPAA